MPQQSPIDVIDPVVTNFGKNGLDTKWKKSAVGKLKKDEHGVHVEFGADEGQYVTLDRTKFHLVQFHFHHPSEHWVSGKEQTIELHVVHQNTREEGRAVIGIFIEPDDSAKSVPALVPYLKSFAEDPEGHGGEEIPTNPLEWLPGDSEHYYRYEGSLTTPGYDEDVKWVVLKDPLLLPKAELNDLIKIFKHPARWPQPLNRRFVLANFT